MFTRFYALLRAFTQFTVLSSLLRLQFTPFTVYSVQGYRRAKQGRDNFRVYHTKLQRARHVLFACNAFGLMQAGDNDKVQAARSED